MRFSSLTKDLVLLFLLSIMWVFYFDGILNKGQHEVYVCKQADCLSLTQHYSEDPAFIPPVLPATHRK